MKTIGVIGGLGPQATMDFEARVHAVAQQLIPQAANTGYPPMVVFYLRRPPMILGPDFRPVLPLRPEPALLEAASRLGPICDFLVMAAHGPHAFQAEVELAAGRPVLSIIDPVLAEVTACGWRRAGVLGLGGPHAYKEPLRRLGITCETIPPGLQEGLDRAIIALQEGQLGPGSRLVLREAIAGLQAQGVDGVILGCTELPLMLDGAVDDPFLINPTQLLAEAAVRHAVAA